jgi:allophanate hydrolase subunit 2
MTIGSLAVVRVQGLATVQDLGVHGFMHEALPPGGALVPELLVAANRAVGNADAALAVEVQGRLVIRAIAPVLVAVDEQPAHELEVGAELEVVSGTRRCAYLAVRGGLVGTPSRDRERGAVLSAGIGGGLVAGASLELCTLPETAAMRGRVVDGADARLVDDADARLVSGAASRLVGGAASRLVGGAPSRLVDDADALLVDGATIRVIAGPDLDAFGDGALAILASAPYRILPASNRVGTRLAGPALPRRAEVRERSRPMVIGALEVPRDGQPIVLGPEHPTTGGYPVIGVIASAELGRFHAIRLGGSVRFDVATAAPGASVTSSR